MAFQSTGCTTLVLLHPAPAGTHKAAVASSEAEGDPLAAPFRGESGILALILVRQTPTVQSSSNYLFGTEGSSQIAPLSSDLL